MLCLEFSFSIVVKGLLLVSAHLIALYSCELCGSIDDVVVVLYFGLCKISMKI